MFELSITKEALAFIKSEGGAVTIQCMRLGSG